MDENLTTPNPEPKPSDKILMVKCPHGVWVDLCEMLKKTKLMPADYAGALLVFAVNKRLNPSLLVDEPDVRDVVLVDIKEESIPFYNPENSLYVSKEKKKRKPYKKRSNLEPNQSVGKQYYKDEKPHDQFVPETHNDKQKQILEGLGMGHLVKTNGKSEYFYCREDSLNEPRCTNQCANCWNKEAGLLRRG